MDNKFWPQDACKLESDEFEATAVFPEGQLLKIGKKAMGILGMKVKLPGAKSN